MTPAFEITAAGEDVTGLIADRLLSLSVTDEDGRSADKLTIKVDDRDGRVALPERNVSLSVALGFAGAPLVPLGQFTVDRVAGEGMPRTLTIEATAANMTGPLRAPKTRSWTDITLPDLVQDIASGAGLIAAVGASLQSVAWPHVAQRAESDLNLLTRLARDLDATAKPAGGHLVVVKRGEGVNAEGKAIPPASITVGDCAAFGWELTERETFKSVTAEWGDLDGGQTREVTAGAGEPVRKLRNTYATAEEAQRAATAELALSGRAGLKLELELSTFWPALFGGGLLDVTGLKAGVDGRFLIRSVTHRLEASLTTIVSGEQISAP